MEEWKIRLYDLRSFDAGEFEALPLDEDEKIELEILESWEKT